MSEARRRRTGEESKSTRKFIHSSLCSFHILSSIAHTNIHSWLSSFQNIGLIIDIGFYKQENLRGDELAELEGETDKQGSTGSLGRHTRIILESKVVIHKERRRITMREISPIIPPLCQPTRPPLLTFTSMFPQPSIKVDTKGE